MFNFIRMQYHLGNLTDEQVQAFVPRWITEEQCVEIIGSK